MLYYVIDLPPDLPLSLPRPGAHGRSLGPALPVAETRSTSAQQPETGAFCLVPLCYEATLPRSSNNSDISLAPQVGGSARTPELPVAVPRSLDAMASQAESETRLMKSDWVRGNLCCFPGHCLSGLQRTHGLLLVVVLPPDRKARLLREALKQLCPTAAFTKTSSIPQRPRRSWSA